MTTTTTLSTIRTRVRLRLDDSAFDGTAIDRAINDYQNDVCNRHEFSFMETDSSLNGGDLTLASSAYAITLPSNHQRLFGLILRSPVSFRSDYTDYYVDYKVFVQNFYTPDLESAGPPLQWTIYNNQILFTQPADQAYVFRETYLKAPTPLVNDSDIVAIPDEFAEILVEGALYRLQKRDDNYDLASNESPDLTRLEIALLNRYARGKIKSGPRRMQSPMRRSVRIL